MTRTAVHQSSSSSPPAAPSSQSGRHAGSRPGPHMRHAHHPVKTQTRWGRPHPRPIVTRGCGGSWFCRRRRRSLHPAAGESTVGPWCHKGGPRCRGRGVRWRGRPGTGSPTWEAILGTSPWICLSTSGKQGGGSEPKEKEKERFWWK